MALHRVFGPILIILLAATIGMPGTYYVDASSGDDGNSGVSESSPWQSLTKVNDSNLGNGDVVLLKRGEEWRGEQLVARDGMRVGAYGSGDLPKINGMVEVQKAAFIKVPDIPHSFKLKESRGVSLVFEDGVPLQRVNSKSSVGDTPGSFYYSNTAVTVQASDGSSVKTNSKTYEISVVNDAIQAEDTRDFTVEDVHILNCGDMGILAINSQRLTVRNCIIEFIKKSGPGSPVGIGLNHNTSGALVENTVIHDIGDNKEGACVYIGTAGAGHSYVARNNTVRNCEMYNAVVGVTIKVHSVDNVIDGNHVHNVRHQGIRSVNQNTITRNFVHDCDEEGIETYNDALVSYNFVRNCYAGVIILPVTSGFVDNQNVGRNNRIYNNTVFDCVIGVSIFNIKNVKTTQPRDNVVKNNLFYQVYRQLLIADDKNLPDDHNNQFDTNSYYTTKGEVLFRNGPGETDDVALTDWQRIYGGDSHSLTSDPRLSANAPTTVSDIRLSSNSPCIDAGENLGLNVDITGGPVPQGDGVDIGAYESGGGGTGNPPPAAPRNVRVRLGD